MFRIVSFETTFIKFPQSHFKLQINKILSHEKYLLKYKDFFSDNISFPKLSMLKRRFIKCVFIIYHYKHYHIILPYPLTLSLS